VELAKLRGQKERNHREEEDEEKRKRKKTGRSSEIRSDFSHGLVIRINYVPSISPILDSLAWPLPCLVPRTKPYEVQCGAIHEDHPPILTLSTGY
jgi:hypothetical protein